jgi:outer membrane protein assembly factor BamE (lipoprotein component of BamABCDE complex)
VKAISLKRSFSLFLCVCVLAGCSSTIGNKSNPTKASFQVGRTSKAQVAEKLGLPSAIDRSEDGVSEAWAYQKSPKLANLLLVVPTVSSTQITLYHVNAYFLDTMLPKDVAAIYVFDDRGILADAKQMQP